MLRVLFYNPHQGFDSGAPKVLVSLIEHFDRSRFQPLYLATDEGPLVEELACRDVRIVREKVSKVGYRHPVASLRSVLKHAATLRNLQIDVLHAFEYGWNLDVVLAAWSVGIPVILHEHSGSSADFRNLHRFAASKVLVCSRSVLEGFGHLDRIRHKCDVLYNPVDVSSFARAKSIRASLGISDHQIVLGTIARNQHRKGIDVLLDAARLLVPRYQDIVFLVVGGAVPGQEDYAERLTRAAEDPVFDGRVRFLGVRQDIPDLLASFDVFVLPTRGDPFPVAVLEAMAAALPVVASRVGGIPEMITSPDLGFLVSPVSAEAFAKTIEEIINMPDRGKATGVRAKQSVLQRFDGPLVARRLETCYLQLSGRTTDS